jgi:colanic acid/amylovoran biosynthesis glycosyltransferase
MNNYPMTSTTFIRREILALERRGIEIIRIAIRGWNYVTVDEEERVECKRTRYVLRAGALALLLALVRMLFTRPIRLMRTLLLAWRMGRHAERPLHVHLIYLAEACRIEPWLRQAGVRHVHTHFGTNSAEVAMLVHALGGPDWSFTVHGPEEFDKPRFIGLGEKIKRCSFVVAISSYTRSQLYRWAELQYWPKVHVVHCGLEAAHFAGLVTTATVARRLVCVGRLCEQKGQLLLVNAAQLLAAQGIDFELVLVGDGELRTDIVTLIARHKLQSKIRITGRVSSEKLHEEVLAARAMVLPSLAEGLPMVIMEAMLLKRPVISTFVAGIPELVVPGEHGWLVPAGDVDALAEAMRTCLEAPVDLLVRMGEAAHTRVLTRHNVLNQAKQLAKLFEDVESASISRDASLSDNITAECDKVNPGDRDYFRGSRNAPG